MSSVPQHGRAPIHALLLVCFFVFGWIPHPAEAQQNTNLTVKIPIKKDRRYYNRTHEDGTGRVCGVRLYGVWEVYKNYTNLSSYGSWRGALVGIQNPSSPNLVINGDRKYFEVYCYFNGSDSPNSNADCNHTIGQTLPEWEITLTRTPPRANFTTTFFPATPDEVKFQETSVDPEDPEADLLTHTWDFGDTNTASGDIQIHRYTKPGRFNVKLTATNPDGLFGTATRTVTIAAPRPIVSLQLFNKHSRNRIEPEEEFRARLTVEASADGVGSLTNLIFNGSPLIIPSIFNVVSAPAQTNIGNLRPGEKKEFDWILRTVGVGSFSLASASVIGRDEAGQSVFGSAATQRGEVTALIVGIEQSPKKVLLNHDNNGDGKTNALDNRVQIIVSVTNVVKVDISDVQTTETNDPIRLISLASQPNIYMIATNTALGVFGTIPPGESRSITNTYEAWGRVYAEAQSVVHGKADGVPVDAAGKGTIDVGGAKLVEARFAIRDDVHQAGKPVRVYGWLTNVSLLKSREGNVVDDGKTVGVVVNCTIKGNGVGGFVFEASSGGETPRAPTPFLLRPGQSIKIEGIIATSEISTNTSMDVVYSVWGYVHEGAEDPRKARPSEIEVMEETDDQGNHLYSSLHHVELPPAPRITDPWDECPIDHVHYYSCRTLRGLETAFGGFKDLVSLTLNGTYQFFRGSAKLAAYFVWTERQRIKAMLGDKKAQERLATQIAADWEAFRVIGSNLLQGAGEIPSSMERALMKFDHDIREGGLKYVAGAILETIAENPDMVAETWIAARTRQRIAREAAKEGAENVAERAWVEALEKQTRELAGDVEEFAARRRISELPKSGELPLGMNVRNLPRIWRDAYGATAREIENLLEICRKEGIIITFRSRSPKSAALIDKGLALLKPGGVTIKTVNEIDRLYLGYPDKFDSLCVLLEPPIAWRPPGPGRDALIERYLQRFPQLSGGSDFSKDLRAQVIQRLEQRLDEWPKQLEKFKKYHKEGIDVGFNTERQFGGHDAYKDVVKDRENFRNARIQTETVPAGQFQEDFARKAYVLQMEEAPGSGIFKPITGDIDLLGIFDLDGSLLDPDRRLEIYEILKKAGAQHGESFTYYMEDLRKDFLDCCTPNGENEVMLAATPFDQLITTQFVDDLSVIKGGPNDALRVGEEAGDEFAFLAGIGGETLSAERPFSGAETLIPGDTHVIVSTTQLATLANALDAELSRTNGVPVQVGPNGEPAAYVPPGGGSSSSSSSAVFTGLAAKGAIRQLQADPITAQLEAALASVITAGYVPEPAPMGKAGGTWRKATVQDLGNGGVLKLSPFTFLIADVPAGATILPTLNASDIGAAASSPFFAVGDTVVIDPGGPNEELATLVSASPMTLSRPLSSPKFIGTTILFLSGVSDIGNSPSALPALDHLLVWLRAGSGLTLTNGSNVVSWTDQSRNGFVFASRSEGARPTFVANAVNGSPALRFDPAYRQQLNASLGVTLSNATIFTLMRLNPQSGTRYMYAFGTRNTSGYMMTLARRGGDDAYHYDGAAEWANPGTWGDTNFVVLSQVYGGSGPDHHRLDLNGRTVIDSRTSTGRGYSAVTDQVVIGNYLSATYNFSGDFMEWIVYNRSLSESEKSQVEDYLRRRAGLPPFPAKTNFSVSSVGFRIGSQGGQAASWNYNLNDGVTRATGGTIPSVSLLDEGFQGEEVHTRLSATGTNGAFGLFFGYENRGNFYLLDWRAAGNTNSLGAVAPAGLRLIHFHSPPGVEVPRFSDFYESTNSLYTTVLMTNQLTWVPDRLYDVILTPAASGLTIEILDGGASLLAWLLSDWTGPVGGFGHYSHGAEAAAFGPTTITAAPLEEPILISISRGLTNGQWTIEWIGGPGPFLLEKTSSLGSRTWEAVGSAENSFSRNVSAEGAGAFFRVRRVTAP